MTDPDRRPTTGEPESEADIAVECLTCGRASLLPGRGAAGTLPLVQLTRRLRCSGCGSRAVKAARVETPRDVARQIRSRIRSRRG